MLEEPVFGGNVGDIVSGGEAIGRSGGVFFGNVFEGSERDEANLFPEGGGIESGGGNGGVEAESPADFVGHPIANARAGVLIEEQGFEWFFGVSLDQFSHVGQGEFGILWLGREGSPGIGAVVEHDAPKHTVVIKNQRGGRSSDDEVIVFLGLVAGRGG